MTSLPGGRSQRARQRGASAILMIAVLVLLGGLMTFAIGMVTSAQSGYNREIASGRADSVARAGLDWGRYRVSIPVVPQCPPAQSITNLAGSGSRFTVTVRCTATGPLTESGNPITSYHIEATACNQPQAGQCPNATASADYVERMVATQVIR